MAFSASEVTQTGEKSSVNPVSVVYSEQVETSVQISNLTAVAQETIADKALLSLPRTHASMFRTSLQIQPVYIVRAELYPPPQSQYNLSYIIPEPELSPWFIFKNKNSQSRLSGWKDGNSLYTASITYH